MNDNRVRIDGPHPLYVEATAGGARIDISRPLETFILALIRDHAEELAELAELDATAHNALLRGNNDSLAGHERDALVQALIEQVGGDIVLYGDKVRQTADALHGIARPKAVPTQRRTA